MDKKNLIKENKELKSKIEQLENLLILDPLTKVYNRRYIEVELKRIFQEVSMIRGNSDRRTSKKGELSIVFLDIDNFKQKNDIYGHQAGDLVLKKVSSLIKNKIRITDKIARYGGEEFLIILEKSNQIDAFKKVERIREIISNKTIEVKGSSINVTITLGIASLSDEQSVEQLIEEADKALYQGKHSGKNKTVIYKQKSA
ncbi:MAG: hypothetical protein Athens101410_69 [Parcubacteria group bacterium Athens1014_10]|nr:MAG: hypothetical protein Athens101410_69 [Parcubacteria group bacterium Athens1014_10]TSD06095.1 MAG: hypothetical protein Athens071412_69 [Parcubacteria group bacterium Athens0714_12]